MFLNRNLELCLDGIHFNLPGGAVIIPILIDKILILPPIIETPALCYCSNKQKEKDRTLFRRNNCCEPYEIRNPNSINRSPVLIKAVWWRSVCALPPGSCSSGRSGLTCQDTVFSAPLFSLSLLRDSHTHTQQHTLSLLRDSHTHTHTHTHTQQHSY